MYNSGIGKYKSFVMTKVKFIIIYAKYEPFILAHQDTQVYYLRYPGWLREN